ncbi:MAG: hypothetical protein KDC26_03435 [Armatimonadetes bacterium]|nr:hypothetical protein [Armatimonadota bacterium]
MDSFKITSIVLGVLLLLCCGGGIFMMSQVTDAMDKRATEAKEFGDAATVQILKGWDAEVLSDLATKRYRDSFTVEQFQKSLDGNKKALGAFSTGSGQAKVIKADKDGDKKVLKMEYTNRASFENGRGKVVMHLLVEDKTWKIDLFRIDPDDG